MASPVPSPPISRGELSRQLGAELVQERQAADHPRLGSVPALRGRVLMEQGLLVSEELYLRRQGFQQRFTEARSWLLLVQQGRLALDLGDRRQPQLLVAGATNLCLTRIQRQEFTVLEAPLQLVRLALPVHSAWTPAEWLGRQPLPLLLPMLKLLGQAQRDRAPQSTCQRLAEVLQGYCTAELEAVGIQLAAVADDPLRDLLQWLKPRLDQSLTLADLAAAIHLSARRLQELCQQRYNQSPMELVRQLRLEALHDALRDPAHATAAMGQLYRRCQLADSSATRQAFEARYGQSPAALRKRALAANAASS